MVAPRGVSVPTFSAFEQFLTAEQLSATGLVALRRAEHALQPPTVCWQPGDPPAWPRLNISACSARPLCLPPPAPTRSARSTLPEPASTISNLPPRSRARQVDQWWSAFDQGINALIKQVYDLNSQVKSAKIGGDDPRPSLDQRDIAVQNLPSWSVQRRTA